MTEFREIYLQNIDLGLSKAKFGLENFSKVEVKPLGGTLLRYLLVMYEWSHPNHHNFSLEAKKLEFKRKTKESIMALKKVARQGKLEFNKFVCVSCDALNFLMDGHYTKFIDKSKSALLKFFSSVPHGYKIMYLNRIFDVFKWHQANIMDKIV